MDPEGFSETQIHRHSSRIRVNTPPSPCSGHGFDPPRLHNLESGNSRATPSRSTRTFAVAALDARRSDRHDNRTGSGGCEERANAVRVAREDSISVARQTRYQGVDDVRLLVAASSSPARRAAAVSGATMSVADTSNASSACRSHSDDRLPCHQQCVIRSYYTSTRGPTHSGRLRVPGEA
jgi:hypothetical protein